eukprot:scaffold190569_cov41-Prasinocladus_malaysianus.AAC.2
MMPTELDDELFAETIQSKAAQQHDVGLIAWHGIRKGIEPILMFKLNDCRCKATQQQADHIVWSAIC